MLIPFHSSQQNAGGRKRAFKIVLSFIVSHELNKLTLSVFMNQQVFAQDNVVLRNK